MKIPRDSAWLRLIALSSLLCLVGCGGGNVGQVTGTVTADGKPLPNATVQFYPVAGGRGSSAKTGADGTYELTYSRDQMGAEVGEHSVVITTGGDTEGDYGKASKETLPSKYNVATELKETVTSGANVINFTLDYEGEVVQPPEVTGY